MFMYYQYIKSTLNCGRMIVSLTWYHSRVTPPASMPSSPWNATVSLPCISDGVLHQEHPDEHVADTQHLPHILLVHSASVRTRPDRTPHMCASSWLMLKRGSMSSQGNRTRHQRRHITYTSLRGICVNLLQAPQAISVASDALH